MTAPAYSTGAPRWGRRPVLRSVGMQAAVHLQPAEPRREYAPPVHEVPPPPSPTDTSDHQPVVGFLASFLALGSDWEAKGVRTLKNDNEKRHWGGVGGMWASGEPSGSNVPVPLEATLTDMQAHHILSRDGEGTLAVAEALLRPQMGKWNE